MAMSMMVGSPEYRRSAASTTRRGSACRARSKLVDLIWNRQIDPGKVFDLSLPLEQAAEGYKAMDERRAIKALLRPGRSESGR
jgi:threonine dehydrogenase-like Zn-dependent dehydrogenase